MSIIHKTFHRLVCAGLILALLPGSACVQAAPLGSLPQPNETLSMSAAYTPAILKGMVVHPDKPLNFDMIMDTGTDRLGGTALRAEAEIAAKYFLAALTVPDQDLWVNLSPYEQGRIIPDAFGRTVMGRDLLGQDFILKQLASSLTHPDSVSGRAFWSRVYAVTGRDPQDIPLDAFHKVWIMPDTARVWEKDGKVLIVNSHLKVLLEGDYLAREQAAGRPVPAGNTGSADGLDMRVQQIMREELLPLLEREVNEGAHFARLRQIYAGMVLAAWYRDRLKDALLTRASAGRNKVDGVLFSGGPDRDAIYQRYLESVKQGVFNFVREEPAAHAAEDIVPRKYFAGGVDARRGIPLQVMTEAAQAPREVASAGDMAMVSVDAVVVVPVDKAMIWFGNISAVLSAVLGAVGVGLGGPMAVLDPLAAVPRGLRSPDPDQRRAAATTLRQNGRGPSEGVARWIYLSVLGDEQAKKELASINLLEAADLLRAFRQVETEADRQLLASVLGNGGKNGMRALAAALQEKSPEVVRVAARQLQQAGWTPEDGDAQTSAVFYRWTRQWSLLAAAGDEAKAVLHDMVLRGSPEERKRAATVLASRPWSAESAALLVAALENKENPFDVRQHMAAALLGGGTAGEQAVVRVMMAGDGDGRRAAAAALRASGWVPADRQKIAYYRWAQLWTWLASEGAWDAVADALRDGNVSERAAAAVTLVRIDPKRAGPLLLREFDNSKQDNYVRTVCAVELERMRFMKAVPLFIREAGKKSSALRPFMIALVGRMLQRESVERRKLHEANGEVRLAMSVLPQFLQEPDPFIQSLAAVALGRIGERSTLPALEGIHHQALQEARHEAEAYRYGLEHGWKEADDAARRQRDQFQTKKEFYNLLSEVLAAVDGEGRYQLFDEGSGFELSRTLFASGDWVLGERVITRDGLIGEFGTDEGADIYDFLSQYFMVMPGAEGFFRVDTRKVIWGSQSMLRLQMRLWREYPGGADRIRRELAREFDDMNTYDVYADLYNTAEHAAIRLSSREQYRDTCTLLQSGHPNVDAAARTGVPGSEETALGGITMARGGLDLTVTGGAGALPAVALGDEEAGRISDFTPVVGVITPVDVRALFGLPAASAAVSSPAPAARVPSAPAGPPVSVART